MAFKAYQLTLPASGVARLSDAFGLASTVAETDVEFVKRDVPLRVITLQSLKANTNDIFIGDSALVSSTVHGFRVDPADTAPPLILGPFESGPIKLSDFYAKGTANDVLVIGTIPY